MFNNKFELRNTTIKNFADLVCYLRLASNIVLLVFSTFGAIIPHGELISHAFILTRLYCLSGTRLALAYISANPDSSPKSRLTYVVLSQVAERRATIQKCP